MGLEALIFCGLTSFVFGQWLGIFFILNALEVLNRAYATLVVLGPSVKGTM